MHIFDLDAWAEIWNALSRNRVRTFLTAFGVFWGIFLLMVLLGSGSGLQNGASEEFAGSATNSFFTWTQRTSKPYRGLPAGRRFEFNVDDVAAIRQAIPEADIVAPRNQLGGFRGGNNVTRGTKAGAFGVMGDVPEILAIEALRLTKGRFLNPLDLDERRKVAVIGTRVAEVLFGRDEPIGDDIRINGVYFRVIGIFRSIHSGDRAEREVQTVYVPFTTFQGAFHRGGRVGWFAITSRPGVKASVVEEKTLTLLRSRHQVAPDDKRAIGHYNVEEEYERLQGLFAGIRTLIWVVGTGTLAAGVIGVSNIMLMIVKERTREIGIRRAIGATPLAITGQIVLESVFLTGAAGYLGLLAGMAVLESTRALLARLGGNGPSMFLNPDVSPASALLALAILILAGVVAGLIPAERAIRTSTVAALRSE